ncbi:predicted protein [Uncinocarpus reesii 1704]|uniref:Uncharacterized protein n=1 Tax=Uncinocarpus reesii (strain UAMH 1704) TaxID=336963 RepID=C4JNR4_UNCRE|nr:uncharacterized protein UREG_04384 [Uncinocarpus reesii 1704]EEP79538.1 predicted protein [Uncinocarpus reesii 1704]
MPDGSDSPPASSTQPLSSHVSQSNEARLTLATQLRHLRELISELHDDDVTLRDRAWDAINREIDDIYPSTAASRLLDYRRSQRFVAGQTERRERLRRTIQQTSDVVQAHLLNSGSRRIRMNRDEDVSTITGARRPTDNTSNALRSAAIRQGAVHSTPSNLLNDNNEVPRLNPREHSPDTPSSRRQNKRVKLDSDDNREGPRGFSYGHYGQVVPGALEMHIHTCDGGPYGMDGRSSWPENILLNDNSLYRAKSTRCNIVLKHQGQTPFCLKKLVIKAPKSGFDGPAGIREGMVFVSMVSDEVLSRTARYHMFYSCRPLQPQPLRNSWQSHSQRYLTALRASLSSPQRTVLVHPAQVSSYENSSIISTDHNRGSRQSSPDFRVTLEQDDKSDDGSTADQQSENSAVNAEGVYENFIEALYPADDGTDTSDGELSDMSDHLLGEIRRVVRHSMGADPNDMGIRSRFLSSTVGLPAEPYTNEPEETSQNPAPEEILSPHARFFIRKDKSAVSIKFDPPV